MSSILQCTDCQNFMELSKCIEIIICFKRLFWKFYNYENTFPSLILLKFKNASEDLKDGWNGSSKVYLHKNWDTLWEGKEKIEKSKKLAEKDHSKNNVVSFIQIIRRSSPHNSCSNASQNIFCIIESLVLYHVLLITSR